MIRAPSLGFSIARTGAQRFLICPRWTTRRAESTQSAGRLGANDSLPRHKEERIYSPEEISVKLEKLRKRQLPLLSDHLTYDSSKLLRTALSDFLPPLSGLKLTPGILDPGHHLVYFRVPSTTSQLLPDGTDKYHYPGLPWTQRLWAGGRLSCSGRDLIRFDGREWVIHEQIKDVRARGLLGAEKIFVTIRRSMGRRVFEPVEKIRARLDGLASETPQNSLLVEDRILCFMRSEPDGSLKSLNNPRPPIPPPLEPYLSHSLVPTPALLAKFSALTFNVHSIHLDPEYTRKVYGLPNLLIHGPLSLVLILDFMRRALYKHSKGQVLPLHRVIDIEYRNLLPLFVNEEMTICCKPELAVSAEEHANGVQQWMVWVQKGKGSEATVAVRGTIRTKAFSEKPKLALKKPKFVLEKTERVLENDEPSWRKVVSQDHPL